MRGSRMAGYSTAGFLHYVEGASDRGLGDIELSRLNEAANIRDRIADDIQDWVRANAEALHVGWVRRRRQEEQKAAVDIVGELE
jgi:hypothetical protein